MWKIFITISGKVSCTCEDLQINLVACFSLLMNLIVLGQPRAVEDVEGVLKFPSEQKLGNDEQFVYAENHVLSELGVAELGLAFIEFRYPVL